MVIARGVSLGPYEILTPIGSGGMGEVWRARDKRIGRDVAVKILADSFGAGDELVRRFEQEARAAGALNHPGLVTIFDVGTNEGSPYIVMELLDGETVRDAIDRSSPNPLPIRKTIDYAIQIAEALAVAHEKGIIHRDLKPENLFLTSDRRVKILDFGLAKLAEAKDGDGRQRTGRHLTSAGIVVGTPGYMSPEQVRAQPLDPRTDIFSLGSVLYEMISGKSPFERESAIETMHAVLSTEPEPLVNLRPDVPVALEAIVRHCMEKDPRERFQSARDLAFQLRTMPEVTNGMTDTRRIPQIVRRSVPWRTIAGILLATLVIGGAGYGVARYRAAAASSANARMFQQLTSADGVELFPTLAPDGKSFAYVSTQSGNRDIYVQRVDGRSAINITSDSPDDDSEPAFSPDGSHVAFRSERNGGGIFIMGVTGESVRRMTNDGHNPSWSPDGTRIVISTAAAEMRPHVQTNNGELWIIDTRSGKKQRLVHSRPGGIGAAGDAIQPSWSPHGHRIVFWGVVSARRDLWTIDPDAPDPARSVTRLTNDAHLDWNPVWSPDGRYVYFGSDRDGTLNLWRIAVDEESGEAGGVPEPVALPALWTGNFSFSQQGDLAFSAANRSYRLLAVPFDASTRSVGTPRTLFGGSQEILTYEPSPDGKQIAFTTSGNPQEDLFIANADGTRIRQLTNDAARDRGVTWTRDGRTVYFYSNREGASQVWTISADGSGLTRVTSDADLKRLNVREVFQSFVSPDGRTLAAETGRPGVLIHLDRTGPARMEVLPDLIVATRWSPDGKRLLAFRKDREEGGIGIYDPATRRFDLVLDRGFTAQWLPSGKQIVFFDAKGANLVDVETRGVDTVPFPALPGVSLQSATVARLAVDGKTVYLRQILEQSDIWLMRPVAK